MSLAPREQETLAVIENALRAKDPGLDAMFRVFDKRDPTSRRQLPLSISLSVARHGAGAVILLLATIVTLIATCAVGMALQA